MTKYGQNLIYKYNAAGLRTEKTFNGVTTTYRWVGDKVTQETNGTDTILYSYDAQVKLVSFNLNGTEYFYVRNGQGDITGILNGAGTQVVTYVYDSWGKLVSTTGSLASTVGVKNPYRYRGYRYDTETGLYYLQSRYYNPDWGRFLNADAMLGETGELLGHNIFAYCANNPINREDSDGESWGLAVKLALGVVGAPALIKAGVVVAGVALLATAIHYGAPELSKYVHRTVQEFSNNKKASGNGGATPPNGSKWAASGLLLQQIAHAFQRLANDPNKLKHITQVKHAWDLVRATTPEAVIRIMDFVLRNGTSSIYSKDTANTVYSAVYNGQTVEVVTRIVNGML